ncbi:MAG: glutaredoxin family protein [Deltaproteobacteria bacterium]|nr:glutaredoxin family protein [Deltaproteobacteria bacterium]
MSRNILIYTLSTCSHCKQVKKFLDRHDVEYETVEVDSFKGEERAGVIKKIKEINPSVTVPILIIGDIVIVGHDELKIKEVLGL